MIQSLQVVLKLSNKEFKIINVESEKKYEIALNETPFKSTYLMEIKVNSEGCNVPGIWAKTLNLLVHKSKNLETSVI